MPYIVTRTRPDKCSCRAVATLEGDEFEALRVRWLGRRPAVALLFLRDGTLIEIEPIEDLNVLAESIGFPWQPRDGLIVKRIEALLAAFNARHGQT